MLPDHFIQFSDDFSDELARRGVISREQAVAKFPEVGTMLEQELERQIHGKIVRVLPFVAALDLSIATFTGLGFAHFSGFLAWGHAALLIPMGAMYLLRNKSPRAFSAATIVALTGVVGIYATNFALLVAESNAANLPLVPASVGLAGVLGFTVFGLPTHRRFDPWIVTGMLSVILLSTRSVIGWPAFSAVLVAISWVAAGLKRLTHSWTMDLIFLSSISTHVAGRLSRELELGRLVQKLFTPRQLAGQMGPWEYRIMTRPYGAMSGDWCHVHDGTSSGGPILGMIAIGDCVGKGPSAALATAVIASVWRRFQRRWLGGESIDADVLIAELRRELFDTFDAEQYTTLALAVLTVDGVQVISIVAPPWIRLAPGAAPERLSRGRSVGIGDRAVDGIELSARLTPVELRPDDVLLTFTDGIADGSVAERNLLAKIKGQQDLAAIESVVLHAIESRLHDDATLLMIRRSHSPKTS